MKHSRILHCILAPIVCLCFQEAAHAGCYTFSSTDKYILKQTLNENNRPGKATKYNNSVRTKADSGTLCIDESGVWLTENGSDNKAPLGGRVSYRQAVEGGYADATASATRSGGQITYKIDYIIHQDAYPMNFAQATKRVTLSIQGNSCRFISKYEKTNFAIRTAVSFGNFVGNNVIGVSAKTCTPQ